MDSSELIRGRQVLVLETQSPTTVRAARRTRGRVFQPREPGAPTDGPGLVATIAKLTPAILITGRDGVLDADGGLEQKDDHITSSFERATQVT
jgi:hypothetical protein